MFLRMLTTIALLIIVSISSGLAQDTVTSQPAANPQANEETINQLIQALRDDETRERILRSLEAQQGVQSPPDTAAEIVEDPVGFGEYFARRSQAIAEGAVTTVTGVVTQLTEAPSNFASLDGGQASVIWNSIRELALAIVATYASFAILKIVTRRWRDRFNLKAHSAGLAKMSVLILGARLLDLVCIVGAWASAYMIVLLLLGNFGTIDVQQTLYLNAFLVVEIVKLCVRTVLAPTRSNLRILRLSDYAANKLARAATAIVVILGYGQLLVAPIFAQLGDAEGGRSVSGLLALLAIAIAVGVTLRHRQEVATWLLSHSIGHSSHEPGKPGDVAQADLLGVAPRRIDEHHSNAGSRILHAIAPRWHWFAILYFAFLAFIVLTRPGDLLTRVLTTTGQIIFIAVIGYAIAGWMTRLSVKGVALPPRVNTRLPLLEQRINAFVPRILSIIRIAIMVIVGAMIVHLVGLIDIHGWMQSQFGANATTAIVRISFILLVALGLWLALTSWVDYRVNPEFGTVPTARESTLLTLLRNALTVVLVVMALMFSLSEIGLDIAPLLASAGVLGLAIGFGAQKLVQDIITGVFIQLENAMNVGDVVSVGGTSGSVERLTIRSVSLRSVDGTYHIIPFSSVDMVSNMMRGFSYHVADIGIAYRENVEDAKLAMHDAFEALKSNSDLASGIIGDLEWSGVTQLGDSAVVVRARIKTMPGKQWGIGREYNYQIKRIFDEREIEIPYPHQTVYFGADKKGKAPAAHIQLERSSGSSTT